ncbi:MAG: hypothetical protein JNJ45_01140 [Chthonomonas sp.]|nr:hypothetical protein [Chthonomonas sp.]
MFNFLPALVLFLLHGSLAGDASARAVERALAQSAFAREIALVCQVWQDQETAAQPQTAPTKSVASSNLRWRVSAPAIVAAPRVFTRTRAGPLSA